MASKKAFLEFPATNYCTTILSLGPPRSGKTHIMLGSVKSWLDMGMFEHYHLILPSFKNEADGSYDWLMEHEHVTVYESFNDSLSQKIIDDQLKANELFKSKKLDQKPRIFFCVDDATSQGAGLFKSKTMTRFATENRHLNIHSWFLMHYDKATIAPKIRLNINWVIIYPMKPKLLERMYDEYVEFDEFDTFEKFKTFWDEYVKSQKYGCLVINGKEKYNPNACTWF